MSNHATSTPSTIEELTFGIEIETTIPAGLIPVGGYHHGVDVLSLEAPIYNGRAWKAERDSSIRILTAAHESCEFVSPVLTGEAGVAHLVEFVAWLKRIGAEVNSSCGLHIHVGVTGAAGTIHGDEIIAYLNRVSRIATFNADALYAQTGTLSREQGIYCVKPGQNFIKHVGKCARKKALNDVSLTSRRAMLNLSTVSGRGTMEFRCFAGTTNISKILVHLFSALLIALVARNQKNTPAWKNKTISGVQAVTNLLKVRPVLRIVSCQSFANQFESMVAIALAMATKYDAAKAALNPTPSVQP